MVYQEKFEPFKSVAMLLNDYFAVRYQYLLFSGPVQHKVTDRLSKISNIGNQFPIQKWPFFGPMLLVIGNSSVTVTVNYQ